jgi:hypothetical protein
LGGAVWACNIAFVRYGDYCMGTAEEEISAEEDLVTPERAAKGDLYITLNAKGKIARAFPIDRSVIKELIRLGVLEDHHNIYGTGFLELEMAFLAPVAVRSGACLLAQWGIGVSGSRATEIYQNVCRGMRGRGIEVVKFAMNGDKSGWGKYGAGLYQEHFLRLVELMDSERERIAAENN